MRAPLIAVFVAAAWMHPGAASAAGADPQAKKAASAPGGHAATAAPANAGAKTPAATAPAANTASAASGAQGGTHASKPAAAHAAGTPARPDAKDTSARAASGTKPAPAAAASVDLAEVRDRIHARVAEVIKAQSTKRGHAPAAPAGRSRSATATPRAAASPRIDLVWRPTVTWPQEISASPGGAAQPVEALPAASVPLSLTWGPQP